ncbi:MAG: HEAT repeat domain-containing protein [Deltaproteobacteria bacterium]|nr:HEAT repeat domain-containing protein [Deltaproteobacteria bacterium]
MNTTLAKNKIDMYSHCLEKEAVCAVASAMESGDERVRCFGARALGILKHDEGVNFLMKYLNDPDPDVRCDAAMALGEIGDESAVPYLIKAFDDDDCMVKVSVVDALSKTGDANAVEPLINAITSTPVLSDALGDLSWDYRWDIQEKAISALGRIKDTRPVPAGIKQGAVQALIGFLKDEDMEGMQGVIFKSLIQQGAQKGIEAVASYLKDKDVSVRRKAASAFTHAAHPQVLEYLTDALIDEDSLVRVNAVRIIGKLGAERDIVPLVLLLKDEDEEVRIESIKAIAKIMDSRLAPAGSEQGAVKHILPLLNDKSSAVKKIAVELLGKMSNPEGIESLIKISNDADEDICSEIVSVLGRYEDERAKDVILGIVSGKDKPSFVRNKALRLLKINEDRKGLDSVLEVIKDPDADKLIKQAAFECLKRADEKIAVDAVLELLDCEDVNIKVSIAKLLKEFKDIKHVPAGIKQGAERILLDFLNNENGDVKKQSAISLAYRGNDAGLDIIREIIKGAKGGLTNEICEAVKNIKNEKGIELLMSCMESEDPFLRYAAVKSVGNAGCKEAVNSLIRLLDDENKDVRREAVTALGKIGNESVLLLLVSRLYDYERFNDMRRDITFACKNINEVQTVRLILDTLNDKDRKDDHWTCIEALSVIYGGYE